MKTHFAWAVLGAIALDAAAQQSRPAHPADAAAVVPEAVYQSAFEGYVPYREQTLEAWRAVNEAVARAGGHIGIFRGASRGDHPPSSPAQSKAPSAGAGKDEKPQAPARAAPNAAPGGQHGH